MKSCKLHFESVMPTLLSFILHIFYWYILQFCLKFSQHTVLWFYDLFSEKVYSKQMNLLLTQTMSCSNDKFITNNYICTNSMFSCFCFKITGIILKFIFLILSTIFKVEIRIFYELQWFTEQTTFLAFTIQKLQFDNKLFAIKNVRADALLNFPLFW